MWSVRTRIKTNQVMRSIPDGERKIGDHGRIGWRLSVMTLKCLEMSRDETNGEGALPHVQTRVRRTK